jgi:hypothetical protein
MLLATALLASAALTATAQQHPIGGSNVHGDVQFVDDGSTLTVDATATGLKPNTPYFSLIYTAGSDPGGPPENKILPPTSNAIAPCADLNRAGVSLITTTQMVLGLWKNNNDGTGTLHAVKTKTGNSQDPLFIALGLKSVLESFGYVFGGNSYAPINGTWTTVSIRDASQNFALVACGRVH